MPAQAIPSQAPRQPLFLEKIVPEDSCRKMIQQFEAGPYRPRSYQGLVDNKLRECNFIKLPDEHDHFFRMIVLDYMQPYFECRIDPEMRDRPMMYGYPIGVGFVPHHDQVTNIEEKRGETNNQPVVGGDYTMVLFCAPPDEYDGGELYFPDYGWSFKPPAGSAVIYPTTTAYVHGVKPITRGVRYTAVCRFYNL